MKIKVVEYYGHKAGFNSWVIGFIYRNESVRAIILTEDGSVTVSDTSIENLRLEV